MYAICGCPNRTMETAGPRTEKSNLPPGWGQATVADSNDIPVLTGAEGTSRLRRPDCFYPPVQFLASIGHLRGSA